MGVTERKQREKKQRRLEIIAAAQKVFFDKGYESVTMDDVAAEAELSKGTLYIYFHSKQELLLGMAARNIKILSGQYEIAVTSGSGYEQLTKIGEAYFNFFKERPSLMILQNYIDFNSGESVADTQSAREWIAESKKIFNLLKLSFENGIRDGSIKASLDPIKISVLFGLISESVFKAVYFQGEILNSYGIEGDKFFDFAFNFLGDSIREQC